MELCPSVRFELFMSKLQLDAVTTLKQLIQVGKFRSAWSVRHESYGLNQICLVYTAPTEHKQTFVRVISYDNFFKVALVYAC